MIVLWLDLRIPWSKNISLISKVDKDIIDPITLFQQHLNTINQESFADFKSVWQIIYIDY